MLWKSYLQLLFISSLSLDPWSHCLLAHLLSFSLSVPHLSITPSLSLTLSPFFSLTVTLKVSLLQLFAQTRRAFSLPRFLSFRCLSLLSNPTPLFPSLLSSLSSSVFMTGPSEPAWGRPSAVLTLQSYWLLKRTRKHGGHDSSHMNLMIPAVICTFSFKGVGNRYTSPHSITFTSGMSIISCSDKNSFIFGDTATQSCRLSL